MNTESYSPAPQLAGLLPSHDDINSLIDICGGRDDPKNLSLEHAVRRLAAGIINNPNDAELWYDMACAFGLMEMIQWKYLFVAHRIDPENTRYMEALAWAFYRMGDRKQAITLVSKAITAVGKDEDRLSLIESKMMMDKQFDTAIV